jgi:molybdopterin/thiamine biosynthesis adenylyltransferase
MNSDVLPASTADKVVIVVGAGGNIGSHCVPHLGRIPQVSRVVLIDPDVYEARNKWSQDITARAAGRQKVEVQARRLRRINPALQVIAVADAVQDVPLAWLRGDVILACLDSREARRAVNQAAFRLGVPWIDAGVEPDGLLARVQVYVPALDGGPCLECGWDGQDYELLEQRYACGNEANAPAPTNAFSSLGALAASLQAIECHKLLDGRFDTLAAGRQILVDAAHHNHYVTRLTRNPECRFDHEVWSISHGQIRSPAVAVAEALGLDSARQTERSAKALWVEGKAFVRETACLRCGYRHKTFRLQGRLRRADHRCAECGGRMVAAGFEMIDRLDDTLPGGALGRSLASLGLRAGDVVRVGLPGGEVCTYEIGCDS